MMRAAAVLLIALLGAGAAMAQAPAADPAKLPTPSTVTAPAWVKKPTSHDVGEIYPDAADRAGMTGVAVVRCKVNVEGRLQDCNVLSETPEGYGFGEAALKLMPKFQMAAKTSGGMSVEGGEVRIPINFGYVGEKRPTRALAHPLWRQAPSAAAVKTAHPAAAKDVAGEAVIRCGFVLTGQPARCAVRSQSPAGKGFGDAALALSKDFRLDFQPGEEAMLSTALTDITVRFPAEGAAEAALPAPRWARTLTAQSVDVLFPAQARAASVTNGLGTVSCTANDKGGFTDCKVVSETPADLGFGVAALKAAEVMRVNPWSDDGRPMDGRELTLPIRLKLPDAPAEAAKP